MTDSSHSVQVVLVDPQLDPVACHLTLRSLALAGVKEVVLTEPGRLPESWDAELKVFETAPDELPAKVLQSERVLLLVAGCVIPRSLLRLLEGLSLVPLNSCHPLLSNDSDIHRVPPAGGDCDTVQALLPSWLTSSPANGRGPYHALYCASSWLAEHVGSVDGPGWFAALACSGQVLPIYVYRADTSLDWPQRSFVSTFYRGPTRWSPKPAFWELGRELRAQRRGLPTAETPRAEGRLRQLTRSRREAAAAPSVNGTLRVTYVLQDLLIAGGVLSVIQLVNELNLRGVDARIAASFEDPKVYRWLPFVRRPMIYASAEDLRKNLPECDLLIATFWTTAPVV